MSESPELELIYGALAEIDKKLERMNRNLERLNETLETYLESIVRALWRPPV